MWFEMRIKTTLYISIFLSIHFITVMGLTPQIGFPLSLAILALFIPYFGFRKTCYIATTVFVITFLVFLPSTFLYFQKSFEGIGKLLDIIYIMAPNQPFFSSLSFRLYPTLKVNLPHLYIPENPTYLFNLLSNYSWVLTLLSFPLGICYSLIWLKLLNHIFCKLGIHKRVQF